METNLSTAAERFAKLRVVGMAHLVGIPQSTSTNLERLEVCPATRRGNGASDWNSTDHSPQVRTSSDSRFAKPQGVVKRFYSYRHYKKCESGPASFHSAAEKFTGRQKNVLRPV
ncbi:hypothetical protein AVEN_198803-1 [Araneus ventricosus]|uniref:Uncharacterized protein n=1 Tax=Araneus ventricosus TaxID=182803 RepID=A0A4Y2KF57_ARAVE|nr:hypothetical protein AVEN_198803-1 [Araneus ventricosus]